MATPNPKSPQLSPQDFALVSSLNQIDNLQGGHDDHTEQIATLNNYKVGWWTVKDLPSTTAQTATNYGLIYTATFPIAIVAIIEKHTVACSANGTLQVVNVPNGSAISAGSNILTTAFDLTSTANTAVNKNPLAFVKTATILKSGDSIALKSAGTLTTLEGVQVTIYYTMANDGRYRII